MQHSRPTEYCSPLKGSLKELATTSYMNSQLQYSRASNASQLEAMCCQVAAILCEDSTWIADGQGFSFQVRVQYSNLNHEASGTC